MSIVIAHLTDLHVKNESDAVLGRAGVIGRAIASEIDRSVQHVILALGGDSAFSGEAHQLELARSFYLSVEAAIAEERPTVKTQFVVVAGNHDCSFSTSASHDPSSATVDRRQANLNNYFQFTRSLGLTYTPQTAENPYVAWCHFILADFRLTFLLINTCVFSQLHEAQGSLALPLNQLNPATDTKPEYSIALLHHPWNWFKQPDIMSPLRDRVESLADMIMTGHEHTPETVSLTRDGATKALYIAGGVLQDSDNPSKSSFMVIHIDPEQSTYSTVKFQYNDRGYYENAIECSADFSGNPARLDRRAQLSAEFMEELNALGFNIHHPRKQILALTDIFLYPDLLHVDDATNQHSRQLKSRDVPTTLLNATRVLISGSEKCGKTCLAKSLCRSAYELGRYPLFLNGEQIQTRKPAGLRQYISNAVRTQYANIAVEEFRQLPRKDKVLILDDFDLMVETPEVRTALIKELENDFGAIILIGAESYCFDLFNADEHHESHLWQYDHYNILSFGEVLREEFIRKWLSLGLDPSTNEVVREDVNRLTRLINGVIQKTLLPTYPLFLMIVLVQAESGQPTVRGGSYGHLFEALVTQLLNRSKFNKISIGAKHLYLATFAYELYRKNQASMSAQDSREWHDVYWKSIGATVDFDRLADDLTELSLLKQTEGNFSFRYRYHYCFFVAYYLAENIQKADTRREIRQLCRRLYHRETADILLFLSHLSNDDLVHTEMLNAADELMRGAPDANFTTDVEPLNRLEQTAPKLALPEGDPDKHRLESLQQKDAQTTCLSSSEADGSIISAVPQDSDSLAHEMLQLPAAFKAIQILGQYARNHADTASIEIKEKVVEGIFMLAKRLLGWFLNLLQADLPSIAGELAQTYKEEQPDIARDELLKQIGRHVFSTFELLCFVVTKHVSQSMAHDLIEPLSKAAAVEMKDIPTQFFDFGVSLERPGFIDLERLRHLKATTATNPFTTTLLRMMVLHHLYLYNVNYKVKQAAFSLLEVEQPKSILNQQTKRLK
jgi:predicted phosphodiesterase